MLEKINDQRIKAVRIMLQKGKTVQETAKWFHMSRDTVRAIRDQVTPGTRNKKEMEDIKVEWDETTRKIRKAAGWEGNA